jgi:hypothetical protein
MKTWSSRKDWRRSSRGARWRSLGFWPGWSLFGDVCIDGSGDSQINGISEPFGQSSAFAALHALDTNHVGVFHPGAPFTLTQLRIVSTSLTTVASTTSTADNDVRLIALCMLSDGTTRESADVWFANSLTYTRPDAPIVLSTAAAALPELSGYGLMRDLQSAATLDSMLTADVWAGGWTNVRGARRGFAEARQTSTAPPVHVGQGWQIRLANRSVSLTK